MSLEARLLRALDPLDRPGAGQASACSDYDLNPDMAVPEGAPLREAAVLVAIVMHEVPTLLLTRRSDALASHTGQVAFPGGRLDPGEGAIEAALREAEEEIGLSPRLVQPLGLLSPYRTVTGYAVTPVVARVTPGLDLRADPAEVAEVFEVPFDFLMNPEHHQRAHYDLDGGVRRWFWAMPYRDGTVERYIWGATAGMLRNLAERLARASGEVAA